MACIEKEQPCVVSDNVGCHPDLVLPEKTGYVFDTGSLEGLTTALARGIELAGSNEVRDVCRAKAHEYSTAAAAAGIVSAVNDAVAAA